MRTESSLPTILVRQADKTVSQLADELDVPEYLARILSNRGIRSKDHLKLDIQDILPPEPMLNIDKAAQRIVQAVLDQQTILIAADFDTDGATSAALCVSFLHAVGAKNVLYRVPDRQRMGYGLSTAFVESFLAQHPDLIITVDNGITSVDGVVLANQHGVEVIVTDHHLAPEVLPDAFAIVNPNMAGNSFASKPAGVGVAFYVMSVVRRILRGLNYFEERQITYPNLAHWLDLVAIGTIADMVPMDQNNRRLVQRGMDRIQKGLARPGVQALLNLNDLPNALYQAEDIAFKIAPKINAAGRLGDMSTGIQTLLSEDLATASRLAKSLNEINVSRRQKQSDMNVVAGRLVNGEELDDKCSICIHNSTFHEGLVGLIASRLVENFHRPSIAFADSADSDSDELKGSARSIEGVNIRDILAEIDAQYPHLITRFGGHAMAAGLTLRAANLNRFQTLFEKSIQSHTDQQSFIFKLWSDGQLEAKDMTLDTVSLLDRYGPWGSEFPPPTFHDEFQVVSQTKHKNRVLRLQLLKDGLLFNGVAFSQDPVEEDTFLCTYKLQRNFFKDRESLQLIIEEIAGSVSHY